MKTRTPLALLASLTITVAAHAQQCLPTQTFEQCWLLFNPNPAAAAMAETAATVSTTNTGVPGMTLATGTSLRDFLSLFSAAFQTATVTESANAVTLDWNMPFSVFGDDKLKLQAIFSDPALSPAVTMALGDDSSAVTALTNSLTETDDIQATITYAPENQRFGRSVRQHEALINALVQSAIGDAEGRQLQALAQLGSLGLQANTPIGDKVPQVEMLARTEQQLGASHQQVADAIAVLINNQPQIYGTAAYNLRDQLAGPDQISAKITYESSANSLNRFLAKNRDRCGSTQQISSQADGLGVSTTCVGTLVATTKASGAMAAKASPRLAASIEYKQMRGNDFNLTVPDSNPAMVIPIATAETHSLVYSITYGLPMATPMAEREGRFDIAVNYHNVSDDATMKDRLVASITYTQKINDMLSLPLSLVYANHADFLPTTDKRIGVHFGLSYKLPDPTP